MKRLAILAAAMALTASLTACAGRPLADELSPRDQLSLEHAHRYAYAGTLAQAAAWSNPWTGLGGRVRAAADFLDDAGRSCRRFEEEIRAADGRTEVRPGTSCLLQDGSLDIVYDG